jgi:hypothetical protein
MASDRKHKPHQGDGDVAKRKREDRALDDALEDLSGVRSGVDRAAGAPSPAEEGRRAE